MPPLQLLPERLVEQAHGPDQAPDRDLIGAFQAVGEAILAEDDLDDVLHLVIAKLCELLGIRRGSLYLRDPETGLFHGQVGGASPEVDAQVKRLICGVAADRFTQEIVSTRAPVFVADAQEDSRPVRSTMRRWEVRSMLGVPMIAGGEVQGLLFLDDIDRPRRFSDEDQQLAATFANLAAVAITAAKRATELRETVRVVTRQNKLLRRAATLDERLTSQAAAGATIREITSTLAELIGRPCAVYDASHRRIAVGLSSGRDPGPLRLIDETIGREPEVRDALHALQRSRPSAIGPFPSAGLHHRCLVAPVYTRDHTWGYVLVSEGTSAFSAVDSLAANRAATLIALNISMERGASELEAYAREAFVRRLIDGTWPVQEALEQARLHGMRPSAPHVVVLLDSSESKRGLDAITVERAAGSAEMAPVWTAQTEKNTLAMLVELDASDDPLQELRTRLDALVALLGPPSSINVAVSELCSSVDELRAGYQQASRILRLLNAYATEPGSPAMLSAAEVGAGALLLAQTEREDANQFVARALGPVADSSDPRSRELLQTVHSYLRSRGIRKAAAELHVHENTIRYRLARFAELTGLDVLTDSSAQVTTQVALLILYLQGRLGLSSGGHTQRAVEPDHLAVQHRVVDHVTDEGGELLGRP
jgi:GAF domain-containing protein/sugar diacid utilization regulator